MRWLGRFFPSNGQNENPLAVKFFGRVLALGDFFRMKMKRGKYRWPVVSGNFITGNPRGSVAVCTLSDSDLIKPLSELDGVAITGKVYTPNLGLERIISNVISNPNIRYLIICGRDSPVFQPAQALQSLFRYGIDNKNRILNANGHYPVLRNLESDKINHFLNQVELIDLSGTRETGIIKERIAELSQSEPASFVANQFSNARSGKSLKTLNEQFTELHGGGKRESIENDQKGFFVITIERASKQVIVKHYFSDNRPGYIIRGHSGESILLALIRNELITQLSHAGYLGRELAKAELAMKNNLNYEQDQPLRIN